MCTEVTKTYGHMICLEQLLHMCKTEKTHLNARVEIGHLYVSLTVADKQQNIGTSNVLCLKGN